MQNLKEISNNLFNFNKSNLANNYFIYNNPVITQSIKLLLHKN